MVKMMVVLGELGGRDEYSLVEALKSGKINKPVCTWVSGTCPRLFKSEVQFGHAGAKSGGEMESAQAKNQALKDAGAVVPTSYEAFEGSIKETFQKLVKSHAMLAYQCHLLLKKEWVSVMLFPFCGLNAVFHATAHISLRFASCYVPIMVHVYLVLTTQ